MERQKIAEKYQETFIHEKEVNVMENKIEEMDLQETGIEENENEVNHDAVEENKP